MSGFLFAFAALALLVWWVLRRRAAVLPGEVVWRDTPDADTLVSRRYALAGRPDYVVREAGGLVPFEVKSRPAARATPMPASGRSCWPTACLLRRRWAVQ